MVTNPDASDDIEGTQMKYNEMKSILLAHMGFPPDSAIVQVMKAVDVQLQF